MIRRLPGESYEQAVLRFEQSRGKRSHPDTLYWAAHPDEAAVAAQAIVARIDALGPMSATLRDAYRQVEKSPALFQRVQDMMYRRGRAPVGAPTSFRTGTDWASPPSSHRPDPYRSEYERRLASALSRLSEPFEYEPLQLDYRDALGGWHTYTPDFSLARWPGTFIEVKGATGPTSDASWKMTLVLMRHPITLLLWDALIIGMVEGMDSASQLDGLKRSTRFTP